MAAEKTYHHGDLRQALLEAALVILQTKDVKSLSLRGVARQAGVSHTAPYRHFADKSALLAAVAEEGFIEFGQYLQSAVDQASADPIESLQATGVAYVRYALEHPTHFRVMFRDFDFEAIPAGNSSLEPTANGTFQILVDVIIAGQTAGAIKAGDPKLLATGKWALVHGLAMLMLDGMLPGKKDDAIALARTIVADSLNSVLVDPSQR
ncbi:MAG: TetR/AcrR family transcriptional regulator [Phormidesmis sp.]